MTLEEWRAAVAASRPPLTPEQAAALRAILQPAIAQIRAAATGHEEAPPPAP
jgi:hypothetical protein